MHLPLLPAISNSDVYVTGDVSIDASAAIAPGVIIQAEPDSKIIIAAGVCIGMGAILHAHKGTLEVESGAILGAGVLVVGKCKIGNNACIGSATTIWNTSIEPWQVVPPASLLGDTGRQVAETSAPVADEMPTTEAATPENGQSLQENGKHSGSPTPQETTSEEAPTQKDAELSPPAAGNPIYGQANLNRLMLTLFPHNKSLNPSPEDK
ncbi:MAG TPA: hypothetical protein V6D12_16170 [Candidatus Obscuribacterales bacterium]